MSQFKVTVFVGPDDSI